MHNDAYQIVLGKLNNFTLKRHTIVNYNVKCRTYRKFDLIATLGGFAIVLYFFANILMIQI